LKVNVKGKKTEGETSTRDEEEEETEECAFAKS
jgi:hypothetical protein